MFLKDLDTILNNYKHSDNDNLDETSLFYKLLPDKIIKENKNLIEGKKKNKERITILFCVSMTGEKKEPLIIGKSKNPRCFKGKKLETLKIKYLHYPSAWMNKEIFPNYLNTWNEELKNDNRKNIILRILIDIKLIFIQIFILYFYHQIPHH